MSNVRIDARTAQALATMKAPQLVPMIEYMQALKEAAVKDMVVAHDPVWMHRYQGRITALEGLLADIAGADELLLKFKK